jgi:hypothetical protein
MRMSRFKTSIIGVLLLLLGPLLGGCSVLRLAYGNGPQLAWWWLDGYVDFSPQQAPAAKAAIGRWFEWHRSTQLPEYVAVLASAQAQIQEPLTPALACRWTDRLRETVDPALERALADFAEFVPGLGEPQFRSIEKRFAKIIDEMRDDYLQPDPAERLREAVKRTVARAEQIYGPLGDVQLRVIAAGVAASPFNPEGWMAERIKRQRDTVQTLRRLVAEHADRDQRIAALRVLVQRSERAADPDYRAYQDRLIAYNCAFGAQFHNATTPAQRLRARETLKGWEDDLRSLMAAAA